jgi:hypothetical protein
MERDSKMMPLALKVFRKDKRFCCVESYAIRRIFFPTVGCCIGPNNSLKAITYALLG